MASKKNETTAEEIKALYEGEEPAAQDEGENLIKLEEEA